MGQDWKQGSNSEATEIIVMREVGGFHQSIINRSGNVSSGQIVNVCCRYSSKYFLMDLAVGERKSSRINFLAWAFRKLELSTKMKNEGSR